MVATVGLQRIHREVLRKKTAYAGRFYKALIARKIPTFVRSWKWEKVRQ